jgi:N4-gp56 family major capsid protein
MYADGYVYSDILSRELRMAVQPGLRFRNFADVQDPQHQGPHNGSKYHWDIYSDVATAGGAISETEVMPETNYTKTQGTLTITEYGNSVPYTGKLDDLSFQPVKEIIHKTLKNDCKKALDTMVHTQFALCKLRVAPTSGTSTTAVTLTTNGATATTNNVALGKGHVKAIVDVMKERNIPAFDHDDYYSIARPTTLRTLKNDLESIQQYTDIGYGKIMRGEIGRYENCRFVEQTNIAAGAGTTAATAWTNSKSDWAFFFGEDTVCEAIAVPEEIRGKIPGDYGRDKGVAYYYLGGAGIVHTAAAQSRIVMWDSLT